MRNNYITTAPVIGFRKASKVEKSKDNPRNVWWINGTEISLQLKNGTEETIFVEHEGNMSLRTGHVISVVRNLDGRLRSVYNHNTLRFFHQSFANRVDKKMLFAGFVLTLLLFPVGVLVLAYHLYIKKRMIMKANEKYETEMRHYAIKESTRINYLKVFGVPSASNSDAYLNRG
jgi:hypothetical protein